MTAGQVTLDVQAGDVVLSLGTAISCGLILNELVSNALKHGFPDGRSGTVHVELGEDPGGYRLRVVDDGVGLPPDFDARHRRSLGSKLVARLAEQLGATLRRESSPLGTRYELFIPSGADR